MASVGATLGDLVYVGISIHLAWDLLLSRYGKRSFIDLKTPPAPSG
jgi:hypothetical protein